MNDLQFNTRKLTPAEAMLRLASQYIGLQETPGKGNNPVIIQMFRDIGQSWVQDDETSWCSAFINWIAWNVKCEMSGKLDARSWLKIGTDVNIPEPGDVVVYWRDSISSWKGHVGLFTGYSRTGKIWTLGGNQSNEIRISQYDEEKLLSFRKLKYIQA